MLLQKFLLSPELVQLQLAADLKELQKIGLVVAAESLEQYGAAKLVET